MGAHAKVDDVRRVMDGLRQIVQLLRRSAAVADRRAGLSAAQLFVLGQLADGRPASVNELAGRTRTHQSSASVVVRRLADRGLVRHGRSATDGRRVEVTLTPAGRRTLAKAPPAAQDRLINTLVAMPARERKALAQGLSRLAGLAGAADPRPGLFFEDEPRRTTTRGPAARVPPPANEDPAAESVGSVTPPRRRRPPSRANP